MLNTRCSSEWRIERQKFWLGVSIATFGNKHLTHGGAIMQRVDREKPRDLLSIFVDILKQNSVWPDTQPTVNAFRLTRTLNWVQTSKRLLNPLQAVFALSRHCTAQVQNSTPTDWRWFWHHVMWILWWRNLDFCIVSLQVLWECFDKQNYFYCLQKVFKRKVTNSHIPITFDNIFFLFIILPFIHFAGDYGQHINMESNLKRVLTFLLIFSSSILFLNFYLPSSSTSSLVCIFVLFIPFGFTTRFSSSGEYILEWKCSTSSSSLEENLTKLEWRKELTLPIPIYLCQR